jgi:imidazole glycerol-phosphate synthase subunit HisH
MITIVDYGMGNLGSIRNMLNRIGVESQVSSDIETIEKATKLILPGVGAFDQAMNNIRSMNLEKVLVEKATKDKTPLLGICLGMQILLEKSEEGNATGLGLIKGEVKKFRFDKDQSHLKVPHMGWNTVKVEKQHPLLQNFPDQIRFYFVHAYYAQPASEQHTICTTQYGFPFCSVTGSENVTGVQFHPEKSHAFGMTLLKNFAAI